MALFLPAACAGMALFLPAACAGMQGCARRDKIAAMKKCAVYIMTNRGRRVLYIGATRDLAARVESHKRGDAPGFTKQYHCNVLAYAEFCDDWDTAIQRERQLKKWRREWKRVLISQSNPTWRDISGEIG